MSISPVFVGLIKPNTVDMRLSYVIIEAKISFVFRLRSYIFAIYPGYRPHTENRPQFRSLF